MRFAVRVACAGLALAVGFTSFGCRTAETSVAKPSASAPLIARSVPLPPTGYDAHSESSVVRAASAVAIPATTSQQLPDDARPAAHLVRAEEIIANPPAPVVVPQPGAHLELEWLVPAVIARNPDIQSAIAAWRAAAQRYPQEVALDDPMFGLMLGPGSWGNNDVESAYAFQASQKLPWAGKRRLRGDIARAQANAAYFETGEQQLQVAELTRLAYYQYYLAYRQLAVLEESTKLLTDFREIAQTRYEAASVEQQDVLLADVELADLERRRLELARMEQVSRARLNTLLLVTPDSPLPPPPSDLRRDVQLPAADELRAQALASRPELAAQSARIRAERYSIQLAQKEFLPDAELFGRYDTFWQEDPLKPMIGMNVNVPVYKQKRYAAIREASARLSQQQATLEGRINEIMFEVEQAYRRVEESRQAVQVFEERILPAAEQSVGSAKLSYTAGRLDFLRLIESQRQLLSIQDRYYEAVASYHERLAELDRALGYSSSGFSAP
jgi:outer membrane protein, heavy metal efflux system